MLTAIGGTNDPKINVKSLTLMMGIHSLNFKKINCNIALLNWVKKETFVLMDRA